MAESLTDSDRPLQPPIDNLEQIKDLPGACSQVLDFSSMRRVIPAIRGIVHSQLLFSEAYSPGRLLRTALMAGFLLDRVSISLVELERVVEQEQAGQQFIRGTPISERQFTFAQITYLSASSMVELGISSDVSIDPSETMCKETEYEMLFAAPAVCDGFNGAAASLSLPSQRRRTRLRPPKGAMPRRGTNHRDHP